MRQARKRKLKFLDKDEGEAPAKEDQKIRKAALGKWFEVASMVGDFSGLVKKAGPELKEVLEDVFAAKSDATLRARAGSILALFFFTLVQGLFSIALAHQGGRAVPVRDVPQTLRGATDKGNVFYEELVLPAQLPGGGGGAGHRK